MSATVEIDTGLIADALVIPVEAMTVVDGRPSCYVVAADGLDLRPIKTRRATRDLLEITSGLLEGERVLARSVDVERREVGQNPAGPSRGIAAKSPALPGISDA
jgi:multidrug efflux pump subunit AcrA (membrane-fusion protein)